MPLPDRTLTVKFLTAILSDKSLKPFVEKRQLQIYGAQLPSFNVLEKIDSSADILFFDAIIGEIGFSASRLGNLNFLNSKIAILDIAGSSINNLLMTNTTIDRVVIRDSSLSRLEGSNATALQFDLTDSTLKHLWIVAGSSINILSLNGTVVEEFSFRTSRIDLFSKVSSPRTKRASEIRSLTIIAGHIKSWSMDLEGVTDLISRNSSFDPNLFDEVAIYYRSYGLYRYSDSIRYLKHITEYTGLNAFQKVISWISWSTTGYGIKPERGFIWLLIFVVIGYFIFRTGRLSHGKKPRSWIIYSIDTVIPVIHLDEAHKEIAFHDWRQYYLYLMRALSAALAFLLAKVIADALSM